MTQTPFSEQQQQPKMAHTTDEFDPVHARLSPTSQVAVHIAQKGYQAGSIVGVLGVLPVSVIRAWRNNRSISAADLLRRVGISSLSGVAATGGRAYALQCTSTADVYKHAVQWLQ